MNSKTSYIKVIRESEWKQERGCLPSRVIMWKPDDEKARQTVDSERRYATHIEVGSVGITAFSFIWGHYDMSYGQASADFGDRCRQLGVSELKLVGGLVS